MMTWSGSEGSYGASIGKLRTRPSELEHALVKIWREAASVDAAQDASTGEAMPRVRSRLANLVILIPELTEAAERRALELLLTDLCVAYPSRFFIVQLSPERNGEDPLRSFVSSRCVLAKSGSHVCSEEVYVDVTERGLPLVPHLLLSLFVPDVATTLLVLGDFVSWGPAVKSLAQFKGVCDRLMYDSRFFSRYHESVEILLSDLNLRPSALRALLGKEPEQAKPLFSGTRHLRDIAWSTLKRWGLLIVEQFDSEAFGGNAPVVSKVVISLSSHQPMHVPSDALLLSGWLIGKLGWQTHEGKPHELVLCRRPDSGISEIQFVREVQVQSVPPSMLLGGIAAGVRGVTFYLTIGETSGELRIERHGDSARITTTGIGLSEPAERNVSFSERDLSELIIANMMTTATDEEFFRALRLSMAVDRVLKA